MDTQEITVSKLLITIELFKYGRPHQKGSEMYIPVIVISIGLRDHYLALALLVSSGVSIFLLNKSVLVRKATILLPPIAERCLTLLNLVRANLRAVGSHNGSLVLVDD